MLEEPRRIELPSRVGLIVDVERTGHAAEITGCASNDRAASPGVAQQPRPVSNDPTRP
jgi:hypothetical protein